MGGRGSSSGISVPTAGGGSVDVRSRESLISAREGQRAEVDQVLSVLRSVYDQYGVDVMDAQIATLGIGGEQAMAFYDSKGNLAINSAYFDSEAMTSAYDFGIAAGFHPGRGNRTGLEAVASHEMGHRLTDVAGERAGLGSWQVDRVSGDICRAAARATGHKNYDSFARRISGYAQQSAAEAVAEAFADVYCNGNNASRESRAVVRELNKYFK